MPKELHHAWWITAINLLWSIHHMVSEISIITAPGNGLALNRCQAIISSKIYRHLVSILPVKVSEWLGKAYALRKKKGWLIDVRHNSWWHMTSAQHAANNPNWWHLKMHRRGPGLNMITVFTMKKLSQPTKPSITKKVMIDILDRCPSY